MLLYFCVSIYWIFELNFLLEFCFCRQKDVSWCGKGHNCDHHRGSCTKEHVRLSSYPVFIFIYLYVEIQNITQPKKKFYIGNLPLMQILWWICWEKLWCWRRSWLQVWCKLQMWPLHLLKTKLVQLLKSSFLFTCYRKSHWGEELRSTFGVVFACNI